MNMHIEEYLAHEKLAERGLGPPPISDGPGRRTLERPGFRVAHWSGADPHRPLARGARSPEPRGRPPHTA